jgi:microcystin-dependent protein
MGEPFLAEIRMVSFNFPPRGWAFCDGQTLPINSNQSLYSLLGTTYGGDGRMTFKLPDLRGRTPIHEGKGDGASHNLGTSGGEERVTLTDATTPSHTHLPLASGAAGTTPNPTGALWAQVTDTVGNVYADSGQAAPDTPMNSPVKDNGGSQAHNNMQPWLGINFCIALQGTFPSRN